MLEKRTKCPVQRIQYTLFNVAVHKNDVMFLGEERVKGVKHNVTEEEKILYGNLSQI